MQMSSKKMKKRREKRDERSEERGMRENEKGQEQMIQARGEREHNGCSHLVFGKNIFEAMCLT